MRPLDIDPYLKVYMLVKQDGTYLCATGFDPNNNMGVGFFLTKNHAEMQRTKEILSQTTSTSKYHIYEIEIPNPAYAE